MNIRNSEKGGNAMKFVYDFRKQEVVESYKKLYARTVNKTARRLRVIYLILGILIFRIGWEEEGFTHIFSVCWFVGTILMILLWSFMSNYTLKKAVKIMQLKAAEMIVDFSETEVFFWNEDQTDTLFTIPYNMVLDCKINKDWLVLITKPGYDMLNIQKVFDIPVLLSYKFPVYVGRLTLQEIDEIICLVKS